MTIRYALNRIIGARNPSWLEVHCGNSITTPATTAVTDLVFILNPTAGNKLALQLPDGGTVELEAVAGAPDSSGTQYTISGVSGETLQNLVATCNINLQVMEHYAVTFAGGNARFTARRPGANAPVVIFLAAAWGTTVVVTAGAAAVVPTGYQAGLRIWVEEVWGSGTYTLLRDLVYTLDALRNFREDVATLLLPYVGYTWLPYNNDDVHRTTSLQRRFYVDRWEAWGDPLTPRAVVSGVGDKKKAWYAGTRNGQQYLYWIRLVDRIDIATVGASVQTPWLTYRGKNGRHEVSANQQHNLAWYQRVADGALVQRVVVHYKDATTDTAEFTDSTVLQGEIGHWPTGFDTLALGALQPSKEPYKYTVQLFRGSIAVSEMHTFHLAERDANELHIEFISSLGAQESMRCVAAWSQDAKAEHREVRKVLAPRDGWAPESYQSAAGSLLEGVQHTLTADTGWIDAGERDALLDVLHSPAIRLVLHSTGNYLPLRLLGSEQTAGQHGTPNEHLHRLQFQFQLHDADMAHSALPLYPGWILDPESPDPDE